MSTIAMFVYPEKIGIARVKAPGAKPSYSSLQWREADNCQQLLDEPALLAALAREMVGDDGKYDLYLNVWPAAYSAVMFSYDKKGKADLKRLRQAELETVFRGELGNLYALDLKLSKGLPTADGKSHQIIFTTPRSRVRLMKEAFAAHKMKLCRIAPMDVAAAESALRYWAPKNNTISVCMMLDEGCTSISFSRGGVLQTLRTIPNGFGSVLATYEHITGMGHDACLNMIRSNGVEVTVEGFDMPSIQDDVLRLLNRITGETVKTLHNTFGDEAVIDQLLLCGNFVSTVGLPEYLNSMLETSCTVVSAETLPESVKSAIALDEKDLAELFPLAATASKGADLMFEMKKIESDKIQTNITCTVMTLLAAGFMAFTPIQKNQLQKARDTAANLVNQPEYSAVRELFNERDNLNRQRNALTDAIENLPHGTTRTAEMLEKINSLTAEYGTVLSAVCDYSNKTISISFTTLNYDSYVYWQKSIADSGTFSLLQPPTFEGNGLIYTVNASLTSTDFDAPAETTADFAAEGNG